MIIDSHCHLTYEPMHSSLDETLKRAISNDVKLLLTISTVDKGFDNILKIVNEHKCVYGTYGIHPHEAKSHKLINKEYIVKKIKLNKKIIGIGETGLDFYYNHSDKEDQISLFWQHIEAAQKIKIPLIIHTRSAEEDTLKILKEATNKSDLKILIHCFTGSKEFAFKLLDLGAYISASGVITFKKSQDLANTFRKIPFSKILVETDSPYLAPIPLRGKPNEPSNIKHTVNFLAKLKNKSADEVAKITSQNFFKLFGKIS
tara:strand:- start:2944 stop:3720 length:777 start_codon:yes stop_codon:yes gene_type:complete